MAREIEADGFITMESDLSPEKKTCVNCRWYQYSIIIRNYACVEGRILSDNDWRKAYDCCDRWERK